MTAFQQLMDNLKQSQTLYAELIELGGAKKDHIVHNRLNELSQALTKENRALKQLAVLEQERAQAIASYQQEMGIHSSHAATFDDLMRMTVKASDKRQFEEIRESLSADIQTLRALNDTNHLLVKQALDFVNYTLDLFTAGPEDDMVYQAPAHNAAGSSGQRRGIFDTRA